MKYIFIFFGMPIKTLGSLGKIRVGRVTGNTHIFFWPYLSIHSALKIVFALPNVYRYFILRVPKFV